MKHIKESAVSILPIAVIIFVLHLSTLTPMPGGMLASFLIGVVLLICGMALFTFGANLSVIEMGTLVGASLSKSKRMAPILLVTFIVGLIVTVAEPNLTALAEQVPAIPTALLIAVVSVGVGAFLLLAVLRILLKIPLKFLLLGSYAAMFILIALLNQNFVSVALDAGGVATGPITVPFILALGIGISSVRSSKKSESDSFGLIALCSVGPILAVMILGLLFPVASTTTEPTLIPQNAQEVLLFLANTLWKYAKSVGIAFVPILAFFLIYQLIKLRLPTKKVLKMLIGAAYTAVGLILFLTGAGAGFIMTGNFIGETLAAADYQWILVPVGMIVGLAIVLAEPSVHVLGKQVEQQTGGAIKKSILFLFLSLGVAVAVGLAVVRMLTGLSILWFLIPAYLVALALMFFVPDIFTGIAFDSGGVASGAMTTTFLLPLALGAVSTVGGNVMTDAFGIVSMVAVAPLIAIQILGLIYKIKTAKSAAVSQQVLTHLLPDTDIDPYEIIEF